MKLKTRIEHITGIRRLDRFGCSGQMPLNCVTSSCAHKPTYFALTESEDKLLYGFCNMHVNYQDEHGGIDKSRFYFVKIKDYLKFTDWEDYD